MTAFFSSASARTSRLSAGRFSSWRSGCMPYGRLSTHMFRHTVGLDGRNEALSSCPSSVEQKAQIQCFGAMGESTNAYVVDPCFGYSADGVEVDAPACFDGCASVNARHRFP